MAKKGITQAEIIAGIADMWELLTEEQRTLVADYLEIKRYKKNQTIYTEGTQPSHLLCLLEGKVKIYRDGVGGRSQIMRVIKPVEYFGYRAYFAEENFVTAAAAFEASTVCTIPMNVITQLVTENNRLAMFFIKLLAIDLGIADERTVNLTQKHIRGRLAESLIFLKETYGLEEDGATISIFLSREDLANLSNMTTSNAIRTLSNFALEKLIAIDGRKIKIIDEEGLKKISRIMTKFTCHRYLLYTILALLHCVGQCAMAQDAHEEEPRFVYDIDNVNFFDNREVHSPYQVSQTLFASRLDAEIGIQFDANSIMVGIMAVKDFGQSGTAKQELNFYYHYEEGNFSGAFGAFPRKRLKQELPNIFVYDSIRYYSPTIYGALIQYTTNFGYAEFYCNWLNKQGKGQREIFELITDGRFGHKGYYFGWNIQLTHFSVPRPSNGLHVYDKLMIYPHVGIERSPSSMIDAISLEAGCLLSLNRDRSDMLWHSPIGFL